MGIVNPGTSVLYSDIPADTLEKIEDVVLNRRPDAAERLIELAEALKETMGGTSGQAAVKQDAWREESVQERLKYADVYKRQETEVMAYYFLSFRIGVRCSRDQPDGAYCRINAFA